MNFEKKIFDIDAIFNTGIFFCNYGGFYEFSVGLGGAHSNSHFDGFLVKNGQTQFHGAVLVMSNSDLNFIQLWLYRNWKFVNLYISSFYLFVDLFLRRYAFGQLSITGVLELKPGDIVAVEKSYDEICKLTAKNYFIGFLLHSP